MQTSAQYQDGRGSFHYVIAPQLGPCGTCGKMTAIFIDRSGTTQCVDCDLKDGRNAERLAGRIEPDVRDRTTDSVLTGSAPSR